MQTKYIHCALQVAHLSAWKYLKKPINVEWELNPSGSGGPSIYEHWAGSWESQLSNSQLFHWLADAWLLDQLSAKPQQHYTDPTSFLMITVHFPSCHCPLIISQQYLPFLFECLLGTSWGEMGLGDGCQSDEKCIVGASISTVASCMSTKCNIGPILVV